MMSKNVEEDQHNQTEITLANVGTMSVCTYIGISTACMPTVSALTVATAVAAFVVVVSSAKNLWMLLLLLLPSLLPPLSLPP
jgi:hypothetical protein